MNYAYLEIGLQEVSNEIALCIGITGCTVHCPGCHSPELHDPNYGSLLTEEVYKDTLAKYKNKCSCICFMGGDQYKEDLIKYLEMAHEEGFLTALYTGQNWVDYDIMEQLDFLKVGPFIEELGGLSEKTTNQRMYKIDNGVMEDITSSFWR
jgi:anaerobic ribonucleoside-triphosphate reductase activating protein